MLVVALLVATLALCGFYLAGGRGWIGRVVGRFGRDSRPRAMSLAAAGTLAMFAVPALLGLTLLGELRAIVDLPEPLWLPAYWAGWSGEGDMALLFATLKPLGLGAAIGIAILAWRRWRGKRTLGLIYRSPLAMRSWREAPAAALIALAAGVGEELFFRLWLPLIVALATGSAAAGLALGFVVFVALHRHQGWVGMAAVALVGAGLMWLYLVTGLLWAAMAVHALIDLNALILRPVLSSGWQRD